ncbi:MAG: YigZ family protein [Humibacillus sp.]
MSGMPSGGPRSYLTLASASRAELEVRRSRFVCDVAPASSEDSVRALVARARSVTRDAGHHCSASILGADGAVARCTDNGEPSGTAGAPMLEVLRGRGLTDVVAVVTRWFGGTLLGTGGLVRAYGDAVQLALDAATVVTMERHERFVLDVSLRDGPRLEHTLRGLAGAHVTGVEHSPEGIRLHVSATTRAASEVRRFVAVATSGSGTLLAGEPTWAPAAAGSR